MANRIDRRDQFLDLVERVVTEHPTTVAGLSPSQRTELETVAAQRQLTPEAVLILSDAEVLASIRAQREARALALEIRAEAP